MPSNSLQLSGRFEIPSPLETGHIYACGIELKVNKKEEVDLENGELEYIFKAKPIRGEVMTDLGKIRFEKKSSQSQKLRGQLIHIAEEAQIDGNEFYESTLVDIRHFLPLIIPQMAEWKKQQL